MKSRIYWFLTNFKVNIKVKNYFAIRNSEDEVAPSKTKGDPAVIQYIKKELNLPWKVFKMLRNWCRVKFRYVVLRKTLSLEDIVF